MAHPFSPAGGPFGPSPSDAPMGYNHLDIGSSAYQRAGLHAKPAGEHREA
jgi:hypothetical protein